MMEQRVALTEDPIVGGAAAKGGVIHIPDEPGIGTESDPQYLAKLEEIQ